VRERATRELEKLGDPARPTQRKRLAQDVSLEMSRRLTKLLARLDAKEMSPEQVQALRALRVLEEQNTPETRLLLKQLAAGDPEDRFTQEAQSVLTRLAAKNRSTRP
jgi:hypothetical protein